MTRISELKTDSMDETTRRDYLKNFSKRMLKTYLFVGSFQEKRFVEPLNSYRDVVTIDSEEKEFIDNVVAVKKKLKQELVKYPSNDPVWLGITDPNTIGAPVGHNLWVILPIEVFGKYWFKVKTVELLSNEVRLKLEIVRPLKNEKSTSDVSESEDNQSFDLKTAVQDVSKNFRHGLQLFLKEHVTVSNIKESVIFLLLLIGTIIAGGANIIKYLLEYLLKLMRETSGLVQVCSPIIISVINLIGKSIYGLYALIVTLWHGKPVQKPPVYNSYYSVDPDRMLEFRGNGPRYNQRALPSSSVKITPLDD